MGITIYRQGAISFTGIEPSVVAFFNMCKTVFSFSPVYETFTNIYNDDIQILSGFTFSCDVDIIIKDQNDENEYRDFKLILDTICNANNNGITGFDYWLKMKMYYDMTNTSNFNIISFNKIENLSINNNTIDGYRHLTFNCKSTVKSKNLPYWASDQTKNIVFNEGSLPYTEADTIYMAHSETQEM